MTTTRDFSFDLEGGIRVRVLVHPVEECDPYPDEVKFKFTYLYQERKDPSERYSKVRFQNEVTLWVLYKAGVIQSCDLLMNMVNVDRLGQRFLYGVDVSKGAKLNVEFDYREKLTPKFDPKDLPPEERMRLEKEQPEDLFGGLALTEIYIGTRSHVVRGEGAEIQAVNETPSPGTQLATLPFTFPYPILDVIPNTPFGYEVPVLDFEDKVFRFPENVGPV